MTYATLDQLKDRFGTGMLVHLTDREEVPSGMVDPAVVARALADTDAVIDGYLAARYQLPLGDTPALLADIAQIIAIWKLHRFEPDPKIAKDYEGALRSLRDVATGTIRLAIAGVEPVGKGGSGAKFADRDRPFTAQNLKGFI